MQIDLFEYAQPDAVVQLPDIAAQFLRFLDIDFLSSDHSSRDLPVKFKQDLIRIPGQRAGERTWIVAGDYVSSGAFGHAFASKAKIIFKNGKGYIIPSDDIIKAIPISKKDDKKTQIDAVIKEATFLSRNKVNLHGLIYHEDIVFIIMENQGQSLNKILPLDNSVDFNMRIALIIGICNEVQQYERTETVHRDLKPENICFKRTGPASFTISGIDFGLATKAEEDIRSVTAGTLLYMSPEACKENPVSSSASDRWALGPIIGQILNCPHVLKGRIAAVSNYVSDLISSHEISSTPYSYEDLLQGVAIPEDIDEQLLADIKTLLNKLQSMDPDQRPSINFITKFFTLIPERSAAYQDFKDDMKVLLEKLDRITQYKTAIGAETQFKFRNLLSEEMPLSKIENNDLNQFFSQIEQNFVEFFRSMPKARSHIACTTKMITDNLSSFDYESPFPKWNIPDDMLDMLEKYSNYLKSLNENSKILRLHVSGKKLSMTNSSGIQQARIILASNEKTPLEKLSELQAIGQKKTAHSVFNMISRMSFFGEGRHKNIDLLYEKFAKIKNGNEIEDLDAKLNDINKFIRTHNFKH